MTEPWLEAWLVGLPTSSEVTGTVAGLLHFVKADVARQLVGRPERYIVFFTRGSNVAGCIPIPPRSILPEGTFARLGVVVAGTVVLGDLGEGYGLAITQFDAKGRPTSMFNGAWGPDSNPVAPWTLGKLVGEPSSPSSVGEA